MEHDSFYYNALIRNKDASDMLIGPMLAAFAETRAIPILRDTTGWKVGLARLSTFGATLDLPLWEAPVLPGTNVTPYVFTMTAVTSGGSVIPTTFPITAANNQMTLVTSTAFGGAFLPVETTLAIPVGATYTASTLATAVTSTMIDGGFTNSLCSWSSTSNQFTLMISPPSSTAPVSYTVVSGQNTIRVRMTQPNVVPSSPLTIIPGTYTLPNLLTAISAALSVTLAGYPCTGSATAVLQSNGSQKLSIKFGPTSLSNLIKCDVFGGLGDGTFSSPLFAALGNTDTFYTTYDRGSVSAFLLAKPFLGQSTGFRANYSTLFEYMGFSIANNYPAYPVTTIFNATTGDTTRQPITSPDFIKTRASLDATKYTLSASAPLIWKPQHVGNPKYALRCSSYQYVCRLVNDCFATIMETLNLQFRAASANPLAKLTTPTPTLQFQNGIYTFVLSPAFSSTPLTEVFTLSQNLACSRWLPFPVLSSLDVDARTPQASVVNPAATSPTVTMATLDGYFIDNGMSLQSLLVSQEYDSTSNWCPYVGLTIVSSTIPAKDEMSGVTYITSTSAATTTIGDASSTVLFDMDLVGESAHSYLTGISFSPTIMRFNPLMGAPLATISFEVFLRRRDGLADAWDVPTYGCVDLKLLFQYEE